MIAGVLIPWGYFYEKTASVKVVSWPSEFTREIPFQTPWRHCSYFLDEAPNGWSMLVLLFVNSFYVLSNEKKKNLKLLASNLTYSVSDFRNTLFYTTCTYPINFIRGPNQPDEFPNFPIRKWKPCFSRICQKVEDGLRLFSRWSK